MGLMDWMKGVTFLDVIEWTDDSPDTLVYRFPTYDKMIKWGAQLTVRPAQAAIFVSEGQLADVFQAGRHMLSTKNLPILVGLMGLPFGATTPFKSEVYFVNLREFTNLKWGTPNPIIMGSADFGRIRIRGFGTYTFHVADPVKLLTGIVGTQGRFTTEGIMEQLRSFVIQKFADHLGEAKINVTDLASQYNEVAQALLQKISPEFQDYGLAMGKFVIENITLPEEVEKGIDERSKVAAMGGMDDYMKIKTTEAMSDAAKNPGGSAGAGVGLGAGMVMAQNMMNQMQPPTKPAAAGQQTFCPHCGQASAGGKFCAGCGKPLAAANQCGACNTQVPAGSKFCPSCGAKII